jgi:hypothetical protein
MHRSASSGLLSVPNKSDRRIATTQHVYSEIRCLLPVLIALLCSLGLFIASSQMVNAASLGTGHISGRVLNASLNNAPVVNQSVILQMAQGNNTRDLITLTTDVQGRYSFSALESDSTVQYAVYTLYQGAQYVTDLIDLSKKSNQQVDLTVYSATTSTANLAVVQSTILINKPDTKSGMITVEEDFFFENLDNETYVGSLNTVQGKFNALIFSLPADARFLALGTGFGGYKNIQITTGFASDAAVVPGTSRFSFSFQVPYSGSSYHFSYQAIYPTVTLSLLTPLSVLTTPQGLTSQGPFNTQNGTFQLFKVETLSAGKTIQAQLAGLPIQIKTDQAANPFNMGNIWWVVGLIVLMALVGFGGYLYLKRRHQPGNTDKDAALPATKKSTSMTRDALLRELLALDKAFETGKLKKGAYQAQRSQTKARLRTLMSEQPESATTVASKAIPSSSRGKK